MDSPSTSHVLCTTSCTLQAFHDVMMTQAPKHRAHELAKTLLQVDAKTTTSVHHPNNARNAEHISSYRSCWARGEWSHDYSSEPQVQDVQTKMPWRKTTNGRLPAHCQHVDREWRTHQLNHIPPAHICYAKPSPMALHLTQPAKHTWIRPPSRNFLRTLHSGCCLYRQTTL